MHIEIHAAPAATRSTQFRQCKSCIFGTARPQFAASRSTPDWVTPARSSKLYTSGEQPAGWQSPPDMRPAPTTQSQGKQPRRVEVRHPAWQCSEAAFSAGLSLVFPETPISNRADKSTASGEYPQLNPKSVGVPGGPNLPDPAPTEALVHRADSLIWNPRLEQRPARKCTASTFKFA